MVKNNDTLSFFFKNKLYKYKNNTLYQNGKKIGGNIDCGDDMKTCINQSNNLQFVGEGAMGTVSKFNCNSTTYVMKASNDEYKDNFANEIEILMKLNHKNIIKYICSYSYTYNKHYIILPYAQKDLGIFLKEENTLIEQEKDTIMYNLLEGMNYMHDNNIIHNDIKDENILIMSDFSIKYCDFGLSFIIDTNRETQQIYESLNNGTVEYRPPEKYAFDGFQNNYDIFIEEYNNFINTYNLYAKDYWCLGNVFYHIWEITDKMAYSDKELSIRDNSNKSVPDWLKSSLLNFDELQRKPPEKLCRIKKNDNNIQIGGLKINQSNDKQMNGKLYKQPKYIMKPANVDKKLNKALYAGQPKLTKPKGIQNRFLS